MSSCISHSRPWLCDDDLEAVQEVMARGMIANGAETAAFEREVAAYLGVRFAQAQASGTQALVLALRTLEIGQGDEVILPTYVCRSVLDAVRSSGAVPVLCDVDANGVATPALVAAHLSERTRAVIGVHIFGHCCDLRALRRDGIRVIDDACQAFGFEAAGAKAGTLGDIGILSFHATKCLATGEGGMLVTNVPELAERAARLVAGDRLEGYAAAPMSDIQAALGRQQLRRYPEFIRRRRELQSLYIEAARRAGYQLAVAEGAASLFRFTLHTGRDFTSIQASFRLHGVVVRRGVDDLLHRLMGLGDAAYPVAVRRFETTFSLPFYPGLTDAECETVCNTLKIVGHDN